MVRRKASDFDDGAEPEPILRSDSEVLRALLAEQRTTNGLLRDLVEAVRDLEIAVGERPAG